MPSSSSISTMAEGYPLWTGMVFVFNLIVGTGALTLPYVLSRAGWLLGSAIVVLLGFLSYVSLTFIIEASSCANALASHTRRLKMASEDEWEDDEEQSHRQQETDLRETTAPREINYASGSASNPSSSQQPLIGDEERTPLFLAERQRESGLFTLNEKFELGELATLFFSPLGRLLFYFCMVVYLYGDLSIYNAAVAKSLMDVFCVNTTSSNSTNETLTALSDDLDGCWEGGLSRIDFYRTCLVVFVCIFGPFVFFNPAKTKPLQILTALFRWIAFLIMILLACLRFARGKADGNPPVGDWAQVPNLFGACIYSFMCHHSLPSLIAPVRQKDRLKFALAVDYLGIAVFYLLLALTGAFAFQHLQDLYTLNFVPDGADPALKLVEYFLALFPVFTLSASYPIIGITLRNNLQILCKDAFPGISPSPSSVWARVIFPLLAIIPPLLVTLNTENIHGLVRFTGSYAGAGIQYLIPVGLIFVARRKVAAVLGPRVSNRFRSPFSHGSWLLAVILWTVMCVCLVTVKFWREGNEGQ